MAATELESVPYSNKRMHYPEIGSPEIRRQFGQELKTAREFQQMTLEQVYVITKINVRFLENLEEGRWNFLPPTYVKAFIRAYAAAVGLAIDKLSNRLDELFRNVVVAAAPVKPQFLLDDEPADRAEIKRAKTPPGTPWFERNRASIFYTILGIAVAVLAVFYITQEPKLPFIGEAVEEPAPTQTEKPVDSTGDKSKSLAAPVDYVKAAAADSLLTINLQMTARDTCYVKIEHNDNIIYEKNILPGNSEQLELPGVVRITLGNASALDIRFNQNQLPSFPTNPKVRIFKLTPNGIVE
ncbi:MAG: DUF4115 domain-containing protein [Calditrichaeota bacterium]|nr:DUF4115 domain-containing protein [Calditrichota bacterium]